MMRNDRRLTDQFPLQLDRGRGNGGDGDEEDKDPVQHTDRVVDAKYEYIFREDTIKVDDT